MAPLSALPGRVRFESSCLVGCMDDCRILEESLLAAPGVMEACASYRTGRVLVRFDETLVSRNEIEAHLEKAFQLAAAPREGKPLPLPSRRSAHVSGISSSHAGSFVMEVALHALLPAPFDLLLPVAATAFRR